MQKNRDWFVYILCCSDKTLYTGITNDLEQRLDAHNAGLGAKYTRGRTPVRLIYQEKAANKAEASRREYQIKKLTRAEKLLMAKSFVNDGF